MFFNQAFFYQPGLQEAEGFSYRPTDINMDVTEAVLLWKSGSGGHSISNNGFLLKFSCGGIIFISSPTNKV